MWLEEICPYYTKRIIWTKEKCLKESLKYNYRKDFIENCIAAYNFSRKNNFLDEICSHMEQINKPKNYWNFENCKKEALEYYSIIDFKKTFAYVYAKKNNILDEICNHMVDVYKNKENDMSKTIIIDDEVHEELRNFCKESKQKINEYVNFLIRERLLQKTKSKLPQSLMNSEGEIVESITCRSLSPEYKNNMPKELTLIRNTQDGSGFIAIYIQK